MATPRELPDLQDLTGRQVGRYSVVRHLASGGMAELYIARQEAVGGFEKPVVLKVLQPRYARNPRVVSMVLDEARLAAKLNHASIVHVYDVADEGGMKYIAMEYIHGETIADIVTRGLAVGNYLPLEHAIYIVSETAAGLAYAHERRDPDGHVWRIVHRDVSPTNILVNYEGQTKIVDFGIARAQDELREESGILPGKASYMSPEQVRGQPVDSRSDIFALGILLYELTLCQRLYRGPADAVMKRIVSETVAPPTAIKRDYPAALELVVMRALEKRPEDRYQSAEDLRHDLEEFLDESGLRTGNRRIALYMNELYAPDAAAVGGRAGGRGGAGASAGSPAVPSGEDPDDTEALDFERRAPLAMRIEVAADDKGSGRTSTKTVAKTVAQTVAKTVAQTTAKTTAKTPSAPAAPPLAPAHPIAAEAARSSTVAPVSAVVALPVAGPAEAATRRRKRGWVVIAAFVLLGIAAMVIMTLK
jgi:serine/threonine-protein kinase